MDSRPSMHADVQGQPARRAHRGNQATDVEQALADVAMVALQGKGLSKTLVVSIAAGKSVEALIKALNNNDVRNLRGARVCRVMPNTPCMVGEAASALCRGACLASVEVASRGSMHAAFLHGAMID